MREAAVSDTATTPEARIVRAWAAGRRWVRCGRCGEVQDTQEDGAPGFVAEVVDGARVEVECMPCYEATT